MHSGDKIIPERFADYERVLKIVNQESTRKCATRVTDESVKPLLVEMLGELMRLHSRHDEYGADRDPAKGPNSPKIVQAHQGIDLAAATCDGLVLSPLIFDALRIENTRIRDRIIE